MVTEGESAYAQAVRSAGNSALLQQLYIGRAGHCTFTSAEIITALNQLMYRLDTGQWKDGQDVVIAPALQDPEDLKKRFPKGYKVLKPYLRMTPQPNK